MVLPRNSTSIDCPARLAQIAWRRPFKYVSLMGWTSATIARIGYPPPKQLTPAGEKRLRIISIVLVALGLTSTLRMFAAGKRPPATTADA